MIIRPPQHAADAEPLFIHPDDDAWDNDRIEREQAELAREHAKRLKAFKTGAGPDPGKTPDPHPWDRYQAGATRFDLDAKDTLGGVTVNVRAYLLPDATPTVFHLRRVTGRQWSAAAARMGGYLSGGAAKSDEMWNMARLGVVAVTEGEMLTPEARWPLKGGEGGQPLTEDDMQYIFELGQTFVLDIGRAVFVASGPLSEAEGKP